MHVAAVSRIYFVVDSKLRCSETSYNPNKTCLAYVHVWFTLSDSGLSLIVNHTHCTLSAEKKACCVIKVVGPYFPCTSIYMYLL